MASAKKLLLLVRRSPSNAACQLLCRSPLAVAPVLPSGSWRLEAGPGWVGLKSKLLMSFALKKSTSRNL